MSGRDKDPSHKRKEDLRRLRSAANKRQHEKILSDPEKLKQRKEKLKKNYAERKARAAAVQSMLALGRASRQPTVQVNPKSNQSEREKRLTARRQCKKKSERNEKRKVWNKTYYNKKKDAKEKEFAESCKYDIAAEDIILRETANASIKHHRSKYFSHKHLSFDDFTRQRIFKSGEQKYLRENQGADRCKCKTECIDCFNAVTENECNGMTCGVIHTNETKRCNNKWSTQYWALKDCVPADEPGMGVGLKALSSIQEDVVIAPYLGEYIQGMEEGDYVMSMGGVSINAKKKGNNSRFINHCCKNREPNCAARKRTVNGQETFWIVTIKEIKPGEFLCYDYYAGQSKVKKLELKCGCEICARLRSDEQSA